MTVITISDAAMDGVETYPSLREFIAHRVETGNRSAKSIAADLGITGSALSRKLKPRPSDTQRFNVDDLEAYLEASGDAPSVIEYLAAKYMAGGDAARRVRALARVEQLSKDLERALVLLKGEA